MPSRLLVHTREPPDRVPSSRSRPAPTNGTGVLATRVSPAPGWLICATGDFEITVTVSVPVLPFESVAVQVTMFVPGGKVVDRVVPLPRGETRRLLRHTTLAPPSVPSCGSVAMAM